MLGISLYVFVQTRTCRSHARRQSENARKHCDHCGEAVESLMLLAPPTGRGELICGWSCDVEPSRSYRVRIEATCAARIDGRPPSREMRPSA